MKKSLLTLALLCVAGMAFAQTASFTLYDNNLYGGTQQSGTFNANDTFTLSLDGTFNPGTSQTKADGFSLWLEAPNGLASAISITSFSVFQFPDKNQPGVPKVFTDTVGARANYLSDKQGTLSGDLGATANDASQDFTGTAHLADYTFSLSGAAPGTYTLFTTTISPKGSEINTDAFGTAFAAATAYTITVVPEPSTWSLLGLGGLGSLGLTWLRARRRA